MKLQTGLINCLPEFSLKPYAIGTVIKTLFSVLQNLKITEIYGMRETLTMGAPGWVINSRLAP
jgi:hypothetical protein